MCPTCIFYVSTYIVYVVLPLAISITNRVGVETKSESLVHVTYLLGAFFRDAKYSKNNFFLKIG